MNHLSACISFEFKRAAKATESLKLNQAPRDLGRQALVVSERQRVEIDLVVVVVAAAAFAAATVAMVAV